jgi:hypothetical protein
MSIAFVLGNGKSRLELDSLYKLKSIGTIYGCNALYRNFAPDVLVSIDPDITDEIEKSFYSQMHIHYHPDSDRYPIPPKYSTGCAGAAAAAIACIDKHKFVCLIGVDLGNTDNTRSNNVYAGTPCYPIGEYDLVHAGNFIQQFLTVFEDFQDTHFTRIFGEQTTTVDKFNELTNLENMSMKEFLNLLNEKIL